MCSDKKCQISDADGIILGMFILLSGKKVLHDEKICLFLIFSPAFWEMEENSVCLQ